MDLAVRHRPFRMRLVAFGYELTLEPVQYCPHCVAMAAAAQREAASGAMAPDTTVVSCADCDEVLYSGRAISPQSAQELISAHVCSAYDL